MIKFIIPFVFIYVFSCNLQEKKTIILSKASSKYIDWISEENIIILDAYNIKNTDSILNLFLMELFLLEEKTLTLLNIMTPLT